MLHRETWVLHNEDGCCTRTVGAALGGWVLHRKDGCCTGRMGAEQGGWVLHTKDGCCTGRMGAAQQSEQRKNEDERFCEQSPKRHL